METGKLLVTQITQHITLGDDLMRYMIIVSLLLLWTAFTKSKEVNFLSMNMPTKAAVHAISAILMVSQLFIVIIYWRIDNLFDLLVIEIKENDDKFKEINNWLYIIQNHSSLLNPFSSFSHAGNGDVSLLKCLNIATFSFVWIAIYMPVYFAIHKIKNNLGNIYLFSFIVTFLFVINFIWNDYVYLYIIDNLVSENQICDYTYICKDNPSNNYHVIINDFKTDLLKTRISLPQFISFLVGSTFGVAVFFILSMAINERPIKKQR